MSRRWTQLVGTVGTIANCGIPLAAITHIYAKKDPQTIDPKLTTVLCIYSVLFMRWSLAIEPPNFPLLVMHITNEVAQLTQLGRYLKLKFAGGPNVVQKQDK